MTSLDLSWLTTVCRMKGSQFLILISFIPNKFIWWQRLLKRAWVGVGTLFQTNFPGSIFCSIFLGLWCQSTNCAGSWRVWTEDNNLIKKNTRRDGGSTALYTVDTVFTVYNIQTALHCLNTVACMPIYIMIGNAIGIGWWASEQNVGQVTGWVIPLKMLWLLEHMLISDTFLAQNEKGQ